MNILLSTLFSNIINLLSSLNARDQVSHQYTKSELCYLIGVLRKYIYMVMPRDQHAGQN